MIVIEKNREKVKSVTIFNFFFFIIIIFSKTHSSCEPHIVLSPVTLLFIVIG